MAVTAPGGCTWSAASNNGWMTITSGASGTGSGVVTVSLTPNSAETARTGSLTIAGQTLPVVQDGLGACTFDIAPASASLNNDTQNGSFAVTAPAHCAWSAASSAAWLTVTSGSPGVGSGTVGYAVERNREVTGRTATITVGGRTFAVSQSGATPPPPDPSVCEYSVTPIQFRPCMSVPFSLTATIATAQGCTWTASAGAPWITVSGGQSGSGPGVVTFSVADNYDAPRTGVVQVRWPTATAGQNLQVAQAGCRYGVSPGAISIAAAGGASQFDVVQQSDPVECGGATQDRCVWTAEADVPWITITTSLPRAGDGRLSFAVAANQGPAARAGTIRVRGATVQITQGTQ